METPKKSILIIDDETAFAQLLKLNIEATLPYECRLAAGGAEGRRCLEAGAFDYITKPVDFKYLETVLLTKRLP